MTGKSLNDRANAQWPGRWSCGDGFWFEDSPQNEPRMIVNTDAMEYLLNQVPKDKRKEPRS